MHEENVYEYNLTKNDRSQRNSKIIRKKQIDNREGLSVRLADRHYGIGGDGVVLILIGAVIVSKYRHKRFY